MNEFNVEGINITFGDTFFEQIVKVKKTPKERAAVVGIVVLALAVIVLAFLYVYPPFSLLLAAGAAFGAYKLISLTSIEYEYIFTNGDLDIDKIIAKSSRKRVVSINCSKIERFGKYNPAARPSTSVKKVYTLCDADDPNAMFFVAPHKQEGLVMVIFAPDDKIKGVVEKAVPRIARS